MRITIEVPESAKETVMTFVQMLKSIKVEGVEDGDECPVAANTPSAPPTKQGAISPSRQSIVAGLMNLIDKGAWNSGVSAEEIKVLMQEVLGQSEMLWQLLERGRGDRLRIVWQNLTGYFMDRQLLPANVGAPALNRMFFGDTNNYSNIDKGRPSKGLMTADFESVVALLDQHIARMGNLTKKA